MLQRITMCHTASSPSLMLLLQYQGGELYYVQNELDVFYDVPAVGEWERVGGPFIMLHAGATCPIGVCYLLLSVLPTKLSLLTLDWCTTEPCGMV